MSRTADVVVVGAGICGASTALALSQQGLRTVVVDRAGGPGFGSTSSSSAVVRFNYSTWDGVATAWESKFRWEAWEEHLGYKDPNGLARFVRCGLVFLDVDQIPRDHMTSLFTRARIPYSILSADQLQELVPGIDVGRYFPPKPVDSDEFFEPPTGRIGGLLTPDAGYVDDPQLAAANLARAAQARGAEFMFRRTVTEINREQGVWRIQLDGMDAVEAPVVVNAAGPWSAAINKLAGIGDDFSVTVAPMRQEVHQAPLPKDVAIHNGHVPVVADLDLGTYIRPDSGHSFLIGGTEPECDPLEWIDDPDSANPTVTSDRFESQVLRAARRFPTLPVPNRPRGVVGVYDVSSDWTPIYDCTNQPGFYVAMGTSGNQFKNAPIIGDLMAAVITEVEAGRDHDADPVTFEAAHTGHQIDLAAFSRRREVNAESSGTVMG